MTEAEEAVQAPLRLVRWDRQDGVVTIRHTRAITDADEGAVHSAIRAYVMALHAGISKKDPIG